MTGKLQRRGGVHLNEAYVGLLVCNRLSMFKDPETGKRVSRPNPPEKWQVVEVPHLRIVSDDLWDAAQARKKLYGGKRTHAPPRPTPMLSSAGPAPGVPTPSTPPHRSTWRACPGKGPCH